MNVLGLQADIAGQNLFSPSANNVLYTIDFSILVITTAVALLAVAATKIAMPHRSVSISGTCHQSSKKKRRRSRRGKTTTNAKGADGNNSKTKTSMKMYWDVSINADLLATSLCLRSFLILSPPRWLASQAKMAYHFLPRDSCSGSSDGRGRPEERHFATPLAQRKRRSSTGI